MDYREAIKYIKDKQYKRIMVTGPQRSGTTITAKILAEELGFKYIDEREIHIDSFDLLFSVYQGQNFILQAPGLSAYAHMMPGFVCFMRRPINDIIESQKRIRWQSKRELLKYFQTEGIISKIKYDFLEEQKKIKPGIIEIDYASIKTHHLYISSDLRKNFKPKQTH